jgi:Ser/Thr protein kinase RdoA (MazF antagonist)
MTSKHRPLFDDLPASARAAVEHLAGGPIVEARNCPGGFSPGMASRLTRADGHRVFVKAMDADAWPFEAVHYRTEARIAAALPPTVPAPRLLGTLDDGHWVILAFEHVDGAEPAQPWHPDDLERVAGAVQDLERAATPSPVALARDHPRLGGWADLAGDRRRLARLPEHSAWAAAHLAGLIRLEEAGLAAAQGDSLVHFDLYPHNVLLTPGRPARVVFVDWPHARLGAAVVDLVTVLISAAADGIDPEPALRHCAAAPDAVTAVLAAHAGFMFAGALSPAPPGLEAIAAAKLRLGLGGVRWLRRRVSGP